MRAFFIAILLTTMLAAPSHAIEVTPDPDSAGVVLENTDEVVPRPPISGNEPTTAPTPPQNCTWNGAARVCDDEFTVFALDESMPAEVRRAVEEVGLPALTVQIQPGGQTLVNAPTIFYAEAPTFTHSTVLLGQAVDIVATPESFTWHHGDGTRQTTTHPGGPYPSTDVTHTYTSVAAGLTPRVDVGYTVTFRVNAGAVQTLEETITAPGPAATLDVTEARPVIVAP